MSPRGADGLRRFTSVATVHRSSNAVVLAELSAPSAGTADHVVPLCSRASRRLSREQNASVPKDQHRISLTRRTAADAVPLGAHTRGITQTSGLRGVCRSAHLKACYRLAMPDTISGNGPWRFPNNRWPSSFIRQQNRHHEIRTVPGLLLLVDNHHLLARRLLLAFSVSLVMSSSRSEFVELFNLLASDDQCRSVPGDLSPYLSRLSKNPASTPFIPFNVHRRANSEASSGNGEFPPVDSQFPFTFKKMIHALYDAQTWADKVDDLIGESKSQYKPLPEEFKSPGLSSRQSSGEEGSQIRTIKKRCTGRTHVPDPVFVPKPTYVSHHARTSTVDLHIEGRKLGTAPTPTKRRPSQARTTRPALTLHTGARRPRYRSLTQSDVSSPLHGGVAPFSDSEDSEFDTLITPTDVKLISTLPLLKIPKRSSTTSTLPSQPSTFEGRRQTGRVRSSSFGGSTSILISPVFKTFEPDGERLMPLRWFPNANHGTTVIPMDE